jgi:hypothetical protein
VNIQIKYQILAVLVLISVTEDGDVSISSGLNYFGGDFWVGKLGVFSGFPRGGLIRVHLMI